MNVKNRKTKRFFIRLYWLLALASGTIFAENVHYLGHFNVEKDLLLVQFDSKTDVDDIHSIAGVATMLANPQLSGVNYLAVAGAYGDQDGLYVPAPELFKLAFGQYYVDAHNSYATALTKVSAQVLQTLQSGGDIWVAEAGQSNFTADVLRIVLQDAKNIVITERFHLVQHSSWNEGATNPDDLALVKRYTDYQKIPDGNAAGNGSPGFRNNTMPDWQNYIKDKRLIRVWRTAFAIANQYNGKEQRYNNKTISSGGIDFSDVVEICWIFGFHQIPNETAFFKQFNG